MLGLGVCLLSLFSLELSRLEEGIALVWISNGYAVALLIWLRESPTARTWGVLAGGLLLARVLADESVPRLALMTALNLSEIALVSWGVRHFGRPVAEPSGLLLNSRLGAGFSMAAALMIGVGAGLGLAMIGERPLGFGVTALTVSCAHLLGMVTTASVVSMAIEQRGRLLGRRGGRVRLSLAWGVLLLSLAGIMAQTTYPLLFLPLLPLCWLSFRHGVAGAVLGVLSVALAAGIASILHLGPFQLVSDAHPFARALLPQVYVLAACLLALPLGLVMAERRRLTRSLSASESRYRLLAEHTRDLVVRIAADGRRRYVSLSSFGLLGYAPEQLMRPRWELVHPDDAAELQQRLTELFERGGHARVEFRVQHRDGHWVWIEALAERVPSEEGEGWDVVYSGRDVSERVRAEQALQAQARTDALTGLANRREFEERLGRALARARRHQQALAVFALDLDHFKQINDSLGHAAGDEALCEFGRRIRACVYEVDLVARMGGDEFVVLMEQLTGPESCDAAAAKLLARMAQPMTLAGQHRVVGTSIGIAYCHRGEASPDELVAAADAALYDSKRGGRGRFMRVQVDETTAVRSRDAG